MGTCVGYIGWRTPRVKMDLPADNNEEVIWPKASVRQRLVTAGLRGDYDPAFITCQGVCGKQHVRWTWHQRVESSQYKCVDCGNTRRWGLRLAF